MKQVRVVRVDSLNGETHFVLLESQLSEKYEIAEDFDEAKVREASRRDASKPLVLVRSE